MNFIQDSCSNYLDTNVCNAGLDLLGKCAIGFAMMPLQVIIHESGHAIADYLLFTNSNPKIELINYGYRGGSFSSSTTILSKTGQWLERSNALAIHAAAGPVIDMVTSLALLRFFPGNGYSAVVLTANSNYAISTLFEKAFYTNEKEDNGHDFIGVKINKGKTVAGALMITSIALGIFGIYSLVAQAIANAGLFHHSGY